MTKAVHMHTDDGLHAVEISQITVVLVPDGEGWFAQGVELDYAAGGATIEETKERFTRGLAATIEATLKRNGTPEGLLHWAPQAVLADIVRDGVRLKELSIVTAHDFREQTRSALPAPGLRFVAPDRIPVAA